MNGSDLRDALRRDAELVGEPPSNLLERIEDLRRRSNRRRAGVVASTFGVAVVVAAIPVGGALFDQPAGGNVAAPADAPAPAVAEPTTPSVAEQRADAAEMFDITDPPDVPVIALVTPEQKGALVDACMTDAGWSPDRLFREGVPTESMPEVNLASYICEASYPIDPSYVGVPADEDRIID